MEGPIVPYSSSVPGQSFFQESSKSERNEAPLTEPELDKSEIEGIEVGQGNEWCLRSHREERRSHSSKRKSIVECALPKYEMMDDHASYHQSITSQEAERRLKMFGKDSYLTRYSKTNKCYMLTVYRKQYPEDVIEHFKIAIEENGQHRIEGKKDESFDKIGTLLSHYEAHRINPSFPKIGRYYTEEEFNTNQAELDKQRELEKQKEQERGQETSRKETSKCIIL